MTIKQRVWSGISRSRLHDNNNLKLYIIAEDFVLHNARAKIAKQIRHRRNNKASDKKGDLVMRNIMLKKAMWLGTTIAVLFVSFLLCRFTFLDLHGSYQYPVFLLLAGIFAAIIAAIFDGRKVMICTMIGYIGGFAFGIMFGVDGVDQGGAATNNWWVLWTISFIVLIVTGVIWDLLDRRTAKKMVGV